MAEARAPGGGGTSRWPAPAKLNLFLRVTGRRADGYHLLQTCFQLLDRGDELRITVRGDGRLRRLGGAPGLAAEDDLALRAARMLARESGTALGADIEVRKRIPAGGGLGGGSSDAATVLVALNRLWGLDWPRKRLAELGLVLGADVPVFVGGHSAWAEGVGERLRPVRLAPAWYLVASPGPGLATARVFAHPALTRDSSGLKMNDFLRGREPGKGPELDTSLLIERGGNDCEAVARALCPEIGEALRRLAAFGPARMSGTGCSVFVRCPSRAAARRALAALGGAWPAFVARGLDRSPLAALEARYGRAQ